MTDTGQIPGEGLPENAGMVEQPGIPAPDAHTFLDPSEHTPEDDDLLLMPTSQGAWSDPQAAPAPAQGQPAAPPAPEHGGQQPQPQVPGQQGQPAPAPAPASAETHGTHESGGRDSGSVDLNGVRIPAPAPAPVGAHAAAAPARRPLHRGPAPAEAPTYGGTQGGVVRSLADRGPAGATRTAPARHAGPPTTGPEYFDAPAEDPSALPGPQLGEIPPQAGAPWGAHPPQPQPEQFVAEPVAAEPEAAQQPEQMVETEQPVVAQVVVEPAVVETEQPVAVSAPAAAAAPVVQLDQPVQSAAAAQPEAAPAETVVPEPAAAVELPPAGPVVVPEPEATQPETPADAPVQPPADEVAATPETHGVAVAPEPEAQAAPVEAPPAPEPQVQAQTQAQAQAQAPPVAEPVAQPEQATQPVEPVPAAVVTENPEAVAAPETVVVEQVATPIAPEPVQPAPVAEESVAEGADAPEPTAQQLPVAEQEAAPAPAPEPAVQPAPEHAEATAAEAADEAESEAAHVVAPEAEDGTGPEVIETPELLEPPEPAQQTPAEAPQDTEAPQETEAPTGAPQSIEAPQQDGPAQQPEEPAEPFTPPAPGYDDAEREAVLRVMRERRDIRNGFRSDPIPHEVLLRVLEAAHTAPSVGHSQPWDFVVIRSAETRRSMHELAQSQRDAYAKSLPKGRAKQFKELKIEAILDTPVNIVVTADPTRGGRHTLGRHTQPQMAPYSSALAVENLWLAARAEGLGVGWVSFFDEREMVRALGLPEHLEVVAYLCVGYVDEFPEEPELMQAGWSKRRPLSWVVHEETYGRRALPGAEPHDLLQETISAIRPLDAKALGEAWERQKRMTKPAGALGMLEIISAQLSGLSRMCPPPIPEPAAVAIFAGDHGVHAQGVTAWPQEVTAQMVANFLGGGAVCNAFAAQVGAEVCVVDVGVASDLPATPGLLPRKVRPGTADFTTGPALSREEVLAAIEVGIETARDLVAAGNKALLTGEMGIANTTASAALICVYTGIDASEVTGRGTGINDEMHARKVDVVRRALDLHQPDPADPIGVLAAVGGLEHAAMAGFLLGGASLRTPVILDGVSAGAAALVARAIAPEALAACIAGHRSAEPGHVAALNKLGLRPLVDLDLRLGEGTGALLALPIVQSAARAMHEVATFDSAGVTEK
ncbi:nicotinate-nucleotide--dimethylbenzimidazole phosphoribosyltransferase [Streptomyces sp. SM11]|uniref:nicotinate-nucleotide--dimethylbenzimidazole phosphoribosyltransferase n=1 Tax=Streptomyces sp. SM11 TaxID=565557 RepID=UPI000CD519E4|nr:nicotinate-nucleotide--dimethylbenzimidazole phosphoribosyltransferase [Streptomyces sp. SM11]